MRSLVKYFSVLEEKFHISTWPFNILYILMCTLFIHLNIDIHLLDIFRGLQSEQEVLLTHGDSIDRVASGLKVIAKSGDIVAGNFVNNNLYKYTAYHTLDIKIFLYKVVIVSQSNNYL